MAIQKGTIKYVKYFLTGFVLILTGCAHVDPSVTGSSAPWSVRRDIAHLIAYVDANKAPDCKERRHITVEKLPSNKPDTTVERWRVERCGTFQNYRVTFTPTPAIGGYDYTFQLETNKDSSGLIQTTTTPVN